MDRTSSFPKQDFEGMVYEIWSGLDICGTGFVVSCTDCTEKEKEATGAVASK